MNSLGVGALAVMQLSSLPGPFGFVAALLASAALTGCSTVEFVDRQFDKSAPEQVRIVETRNSTRVVVTKSGCPNVSYIGSSGRSGLGAGAQLVKFAAGVAADTLFNLIDSYMAERSAQLNARYTGRGSGAIYHPASQCLIIARGEFGKRDGSLGPSPLASASYDETGLSTVPEFYTEIALVHGNGAVKLIPQNVFFRKTKARRIGDGQKAIFVFLQAPSSLPNPGKDPLALDNQSGLAAISYGSVAIGDFVKNSDDPASLKNPFADQAVIAAHPVPGGDSATADRNLIAYVYEMESPSALEKAMQAAYGTNKDSLKSAIGTLADRLFGQDKPK